MQKKNNKKKKYEVRERGEEKKTEEKYTDNHANEQTFSFLCSY